MSARLGQWEVIESLVFVDPYSAKAEQQRMKRRHPGASVQVATRGVRALGSYNDVWIVVARKEK